MKEKSVRTPFSPSPLGKGGEEGKKKKKKVFLAPPEEKGKKEEGREVVVIPFVLLEEGKKKKKKKKKGQRFFCERYPKSTNPKGGEEKKGKKTRCAFIKNALEKEKRRKGKGVGRFHSLKEARKKGGKETDVPFSLKEGKGGGERVGRRRGRRPGVPFFPLSPRGEEGKGKGDHVTYLHDRRRKQIDSDLICYSFCFLRSFLRK